MNLSVSSIRRKLLRAYGCGSRVGLLLDYDGTLVTMAPRPQLARIDPGTRRILENLAALPRLCLGIVSGRSLDDLRSLVGLEHVQYAGVFGMELELGGVRYYHPKAREAVIPLTQFAEHFEACLPDFPGAWLERKTFGVAIHHRDMEPRLLNSLLCRVRQTLLMASMPLRVLHGRLAFEIIPDVNCHKGTAVCAMIHGTAVHTPDVLYVGDDHHDAEAFEIIAAMGGITVGVGDEAPSSAQVRIANPAATVAFLAELREELFRLLSSMVDFPSEEPTINRR